MEIKGRALIGLREKVEALKRPQERQMVTLTSVQSFCGRSPSADGAWREQSQHTANITLSAILW